jgi:hypothetical protein
VLEAFLSPETPRESASREALARVIAEAASEREAEAEFREQQQPQAALSIRRAQEKFDEYFARHGARLRREEEEWQRNAGSRSVIFRIAPAERLPRFAGAPQGPPRHRDPNWRRTAAHALQPPVQEPCDEPPAGGDALDSG